ncbi:MAG: R3H domain-containing nucleic acid-binding protein [Chloroflexota bacterium]|nr:R3H domain-containing nucleic acid-binding protein [Chloroflexota bacterium]
MAIAEDLVQGELGQLLDILPQRVADNLRALENVDEILEVVLDLGRLPEARFPSGDIALDDQDITRSDLDNVVERIGDFGADNRAGIERTLHRISAIRNRRGEVIGITCRVGRAVFGTIKIIEDLAFSGKNILLLGRPGVGKTTMLREMARVLSVEAHKRVIIVDTSNEIAGDGDVPHNAIGRSRRMQVATPAHQHGVMIEAVENHMPEVIVIDEMGTELEASAARTIAERGVQLIATAHGNTLDTLVMNPTRSDLVGGVQSVTLGDQEARYRGTQKTVLERKGPPTFDVVVEIQDWSRLAVHDGVARVVDQWLRGYPVAPEVRWLDEEGQVNREKEPARPSEASLAPWRANQPRRSDQRSDQSRQDNQPRQEQLGAAQFSQEPEVDDSEMDLKIFLFGIGRDKLEAAGVEAGVPIQVANELRRADVVLTTKTHYRRGSQLVRTAESTGTPVYVLRKNTMPQVQEFLHTISKEWRDNGIGSGGAGEDYKATLEQAMEEAEDAAQRVLSGEFSIQLAPQRSYVRRLQHMLGQRYNLASTSKGREPARAVLFYKP